MPKLALQSPPHDPHHSIGYTPLDESEFSCATANTDFPFESLKDTKLELTKPGLSENSIAVQPLMVVVVGGSYSFSSFSISTTATKFASMLSPVALLFLIAVTPPFPSVVRSDVSEGSYHAAADLRIELEGEANAAAPLTLMLVIAQLFVCPIFSHISVSNT